ncbi:cholesterol esterase [Actinomortierella ambigua]|uniref:Cholesterol esterase n=1 Tax=Actinomortierella ambigua TaxID=1343610 RepID=A0A9P6UCF2_9FUNG|nr:cholesterol esterase [Actinomortierella ambigua]
MADKTVEATPATTATQTESPLLATSTSSTSIGKCDSPDNMSSIEGSSWDTNDHDTSQPPPPQIDKESILRELEDNEFLVGVVEDRNKRCRRTMEDTHAFIYNYEGIKGHGYFAIFDGHAGRAAADWCGQHFHEVFGEILEERGNDENADIQALVNEAFLTVDQKLIEMQTQGRSSGCTAIMAYIRKEGDKRVLYTGNVGDARAVLCHKGKAVRLSYDHKGSDHTEAKRILDIGGFVMNNRVNGVLAVTRALGDSSMKEFVIGAPYTTRTVMGDDDPFFILACDGLWDVCADQEAVDLVKEMICPETASKQLLDLALQKFSTDNISIMVVRLTDTRHMVHIPIVSRLSLGDYRSIVLTFIILGIETIFRAVAILIPSPILNAQKRLIEKIFPWIVTNHISSKAPPLETAANVQEMLQFWGYPIQEHLIRTQDNYLLGVHRIPHGRETISPKRRSPNPPAPIVELLQKHGVPLAAETREAFHRRQHDHSLAKNGGTNSSEHGSVVPKASNLHTDEPEMFTGAIKNAEVQHKRKDGDYIKPVVLLYHGFMMCSEVWLCNLDEERNLAFVLAEAGYDVWLGNARGNKYSLKHMFTKPHEQKFWDFSMDELAMFDMPDTIDYILERTGAPSLVYIGFSQGTAQAFAALSINPELNEKVSLFIALAPATTPPGLDNGLINSVVKATPNVIYLLLGRKTPLAAALFWQNLLHPTTYAAMIDGAVKFLFGWDCKSMTLVQKSVSYQHLYSFTSVRILVHWFQIIRTQYFQMYDDVQPRVPYLSSTRGHTPHPFPTRQITTPIAIFYGDKDSLVDPKALLSDLPEAVGVWEIPGYEHLDFLWAEGLETFVYPQIFELLESYSYNGHVSTKGSSFRYRMKRSSSNGFTSHRMTTKSIVRELEYQDDSDTENYAAHDESNGCGTDDTSSNWLTPERRRSSLRPLSQNT